MTERRVGLATENIVSSVPILIDTLNGQLADHSRLDIGNSHGGLAAAPLSLYDENTNWYDSNHAVRGKKVGTYGIQVLIGGQKWLFPAAIDATGPGKVPRLGAFSPSFFSWSTTGPGESFYNEFHPTPNVLGGTGPFTYHYDYYLNGNWITWPSVEQGGAPATLFFTDGTGFYGQYSGSNGVITFGGGGDGTHTFIARLTVTNAYGKADTIWPDNTTACTFQYQFTHNPSGSWIIFETNKVRQLSSTEIFRVHKLKSWATKHHPVETAFYTGPDGKRLVERMVAANHDFNTTLPVVEVILSDASYEDRFAAFRDLVLESVARYWPECQHPVWLVNKPRILHQIRMGQLATPLLQTTSGPVRLEPTDSL